jgi:ATP-dependent protease ClpP protease subunit
MPLFSPEKITALGQKRNSKVLVYFTSDKPSFETAIADDIVSIFYEQLKKMGHVNKISLFIYSNGGAVSTPWPLVSMIREYCDEFEIIIPFRALSAATLISLGADKILMTPLSQLGPVDPSGEFILGDGRKIQVAVEDILSFFTFAKKKVGIKSQDALAETIKELTRHIPPPIVGSVHRTHSLIRMLARKLLDLHKIKLSEKQAEQITSQLTETLFSHQHYINRKEAKELVGFGDLIEYADAATAKLIDGLYEAYKKEMQLSQEFDPISILGTDVSKNFTITRAVVHSDNLQFSVVSQYSLHKAINPTNGLEGVNVNLLTSKWEKI